MNKSQFKKEIERLDFTKLEKVDKQFCEDVKAFKKAVFESDSGEFDSETERIIETFFKGADKHLLFTDSKTIKQTLTDDIQAFKIALKYAESKEKEVIENDIKAFEIALKYA